MNPLENCSPEFLPPQTGSERRKGTALQQPAVTRALMKQRMVAWCGILLLGFLLSGCSSIMHELQPHRLWRMNYSDAPGRSDSAFFSISDDLPPSPPQPPPTALRRP